MQKAVLLLAFMGLSVLPKGISQTVESNKRKPVAVASSDTYVKAAIESVRSQRPDEGIRIEVIGAPLVKPDYSSFHAKESRPRALDSAPDAVVLVSLCSGEVVREQVRVVFKDNLPPAPVFISQDELWSTAAMNKKEFEQISGELESFFADVVDVSRGSERFYPYFPDDIRSLLKHPDRKLRMYMPPGAVDPSWKKQLERKRSSGSRLDGLYGWDEKLSDDELRRFVALALDTIVQELWLAAEGYAEEASKQADRQRWSTLVSNPREFIKLLEEIVSENRHLLEVAGILNPEHLSLTSNYMKLLMGRGFIQKEIAGPKACPCFELSSEYKALYISRFIPDYTLHVSRMGGKLRIVCLALP